MKMYESLEAALKVIENEKNWCQDRLFEVSPIFHRTSFCAIGAFLPQMGFDKGNPVKLKRVFEHEAVALLDELALPLIGFKQLHYNPIASYNNSHSHEEVVALFKKAIRVAKEREGIPVEIPSPETDLSPAVDGAPVA